MTSDFVVVVGVSVMICMLLVCHDLYVMIWWDRCIVSLKWLLLIIYQSSYSGTLLGGGDLKLISTDLFKFREDEPLFGR